jgi:hypothetical protein
MLVLAVKDLFVQPSPLIERVVEDELLLSSLSVGLLSSPQAEIININETAIKKIKKNLFDF